VAAVAAVHGQVVGHDFVEFDDPLYVTANPHLARGLGAEGIGWAVTTFYGHLWHPLTWITLLVDMELYGGASAAPYLLTNVALHATSTLVLFALLGFAAGVRTMMRTADEVNSRRAEGALLDEGSSGTDRSGPKH